MENPTIVHQIHEHQTVLDVVQNLLDIELSYEARKLLSHFPLRREFYYEKECSPDTVINVSTTHGLIAVGLDGHGGEIYLTRHATGESTTLDVFEAFKPYRPKHLVVVCNIKWAGCTDICSYKRVDK